MTHRFLILGIDPGLQTTGWGIIGRYGARLSYVASGTIKSDKDCELPERLAALHKGLSEIIGQFKPSCAAVEETFVNKNAASALKLGQARGVALVVPAVMGLPVAEYSANKIKKSLTGAGHAEKHQVAAMVKMLLPACGTPGPDEADALAVAICHAHHGGRKGFT